MALISSIKQRADGLYYFDHFRSVLTKRLSYLETGEIMGMKNLLGLHPMEYQAQSPEQVAVMKELNAPLKELYDKVDEALPGSADKTVTLRKFQELRMQLNATIVLNGVK